MEPRKLEGPFTHHVYIGFSLANTQTIKVLQAKLESNGVSCFLRPVSDVQASIQRGIASSQKCLLFLTPEYLQDDWFMIETESVIKRANSISQDVLIILKSELLKEVPEKLRCYKEILFQPEKLNNKKTITQLADVIVSEANVQLAVLSKQNIGFGISLSYFYGFLRLVLPDFRKRLIEQTLGNDEELMTKTVKKMLIIMPESCFCSVELKSEGKIEFTGKYVVRVANRAGNVRRDYKSSLYKLIDHETNQEYYFVGELATPLLSLYEAYDSGLCGMTRDQLYAERDVFYFTLNAILSHPENQECNDQFRILYWSDPATNKPNQLELYDFLRPVVQKELELERHRSNKNKNLENTAESPNSLNLQGRRQPALRTYEAVEVHGSDPSRIYENVAIYPMTRKPRGYCLIINIVNFDKGHNHLNPRRGSEKDTEVLRKLFSDHHFSVQVHIDVNKDTLESLFLTMHLTDHSNYDAFVCCILTHGKLGVVYTSDGKAVEILQLVDYFTDKHCASLKGKPKMFFIQACQRGDAPAVDLGLQLQRDDVAQPETIQHCDATGSDETNGNSAVELVTQLNMDNDLKTDASCAPNITASNENEQVPLNFKHKSVLVPGSPDFLMSYSTLPGSISYRDTQTGSLYIQALNDCMRKGYEMDRVLKLVSRQVKEKLKERGEQDKNWDRFQLPFHLTSGMDKLIYL